MYVLKNEYGAITNVKQFPYERQNVGDVMATKLSDKRE